MARIIATCIAAAAIAVLATAMRAEDRAAAAGEPARAISWEELLPEGEQEMLDRLYANLAATASLVAEGGPGDQMSQFGSFNVVEGLDGAAVRIAGFPVPFEFDSDRGVTEFLLVPYYGACIHSPPPPPNQIIYVQSSDPIVLKGIGDPVWIEGVLSAEAHLNDLGNAAYELAATSVAPYQ